MSEVALSAPAPEDEPEKVTAKKAKAARRQYDLSVMDAEQPQLVALVAWMLSIPGISYDGIAKQANMAWETVAAIAKRGYQVNEWRQKTADTLALVIEASLPGMLKKAATGKLNPFEFKQLVDAWGTLSAQASVRTEHTININISQAEADLMKIVDVGHSKPALLYETIASGLQQGMGFSEQKVHALPSSADQPAPPDGIGDCEESGVNSEPDA
jgi:hypothetical protein